MRESMAIYPITAMERAMKLQEVLLRATSGKIKWWQAAELIGISERQLRRRRKRYEEEGYQGLLDRRRRKPSSRRVAKKQADEVVGLYRDRYFDLNVRHFHEKLGEEHQIGLSYTWVKQALQAAGLVKRKARRGMHRKRRERRQYSLYSAANELLVPGRRLLSNRPPNSRGRLDFAPGMEFWRVHNHPDGTSDYAYSCSNEGLAL